MKTAEEAWQELRKSINMSALAETIGLTPAAVAAWKRVPIDRVGVVAQSLGVRKDTLRPDLYDSVPDPWSALNT